MYDKTAPPVRFLNAFGLFALLTLWMSGVFTLNSFGQETLDEVLKSEVPSKLAPVKVDGKVLFYVAGITSFPAEERAAVIRKRIIKAASNHSIPADSVKIITEEGHLKIYAGKEFIMAITSTDALAEGVAQFTLATWFKQKLIIALKSYRAERSGPALLQNLLYALGAALLLTISLFVILWLLKKLNLRLNNRMKTRIDSLDDKSFRLIRSAQLWKGIAILYRMLKIAVIITIIVVFLQYVLGIFPFTRGIAAYTLTLFLDPVVSLGTAFLNFLPSLAFLIIIFLVTRYLLKILKLLFKGIHEGAIKLANFDDSWAMPTFKITRIFVIVFALVIAYPYIPGSDTSAFKGISVFLGVLFSLGSSSFISNIIAGYSMTYRGAFKDGDLIKVDNHVGFVEEQRLLVTRLRTLKNEELSIPNSVLLNSNIMNYNSRVNDLGLILHTTVGIGYETPWRLVDSMLKEAADRTEGLLKQPPPYVLKKSLDDFAVTYEINAFTNDVTKMTMHYSTLHQNILDVFNENDVQIMTPAYETDPEIPKVVPRSEWNKPLAKEK
jgi:small-conductance mechanosensitive channel